MKRKALAVRSILEVTEKRAKMCQVSGHSLHARAGIGTHHGQAGWRRLVTSRSCLVLLLLLGLPTVLCAQKQQGSWSDLRGLRVGQGIEVIETSMKHHGGEFISVSDEMLTLQEKGSDVSVKREDVVRVSTASGAHRGEHAVIGLVVGAAIGAGIGAIAADRSTGSGWFAWGAQPGIGALVGIVIGAPTGAAVGAVIPAHTTIYRAAPAAAPH